MPRGKPLDQPKTRRLHEDLRSALPSRVWNTIRRAGVNQDGTSFVTFDYTYDERLDFVQGTPIDAIVARICLECS